ncbi:uncharacterized protein LOC121378892 [Gigantopelta aegis]|uniref:uncharacterized protein LOC121378892 n=1 Tax=Gigantopelta aegis TaxID=1735272 RepID=UPI001B8887F0|nr:uncharacterized protein LOC121378892 [Gigantopelta aegis]
MRNTYDIHDGETPLSLALRSGNPNCVMFAKAVADATMDKTSMKILKKKLGSKFNQVSNIMMIQALSKEDAMSFKKPRHWSKKKMGQYESTHEMADILALKQDGMVHPQAWPHWHQTLQSRRPSRTSNRGIFRGEFILMRSSPPGTCARRDRMRLGSPQNGYLYAQRNRPCPISLPLQRHEYPTRIHQIEAEEDLDIDDMERFSQRTPLGMIQEYNGFHQGSRDSSLDDIKEEQEDGFDSVSVYSRTLPIVRRANLSRDDTSEYEEAKTVFSSTKKFFAKRKKHKDEKEKLSTVQEDEYTDDRSPSPEIDYSSDESGISGFEGQNGFNLSTSAESGHMKRLSCGSSDSAMRDSDGGSSLCSDMEGAVTTVEINIVHCEDDVNKKPSDDMSGYESSLPSSRILPDSDETAVFTFGDTTEDGCSERGSVKKFPLPERPPWKSKGLVHMQMNARKFSSSSEEEDDVPIPSFLHVKKESKQTQLADQHDDEHLYSEIVPLSENESEKETTQATSAQETCKQPLDVSHSGSSNLGLNSSSLAAILKHSITNGTFKRTVRGIPPAHNTCNPVFSSENIVKDPSTLERRRNQSSARRDSATDQTVKNNERQKMQDKRERQEREQRQYGEKIRDRQEREEKQVREDRQAKEERQVDKQEKVERHKPNNPDKAQMQATSDSDEGIGSHDDSAEHVELKLVEKEDNEPKKRGLKIKELQEILIKKDLPFANPALILGIQAKKQEAKEPRKNPVTVALAARTRRGSCSDSDTEVILKPSAIVSPKRAAPPIPNTTSTMTTSLAPPAPPLPPPPSTLPKVNRNVTNASAARLASRKCERDSEKTYATTTKLSETKDELCFDEETKARISSIKSMLQRATFADKPMGTMSLPRKISSVS